MPGGMNGHAGEHRVSLYVRQARETNPEDYEELAAAMELGRINRERLMRIDGPPTLPPPPGGATPAEVAMLWMLGAALAVMVAFGIAFVVALW